MQVNGLNEPQRRNESEGWRLWSTEVRSLTPRCWGASPAHCVLVVTVRPEHVGCDPKDGELCLCRLKPEETLVEDRSGFDVQIDRLT